MRVTFDSNVYRRITSPEVFTKDPRYADFQRIHNAVVTGAILGCLSETIVTLEAIQKTRRMTYFGESRLAVDFTETEGDDGSVRILMCLGPRNSLHPGLHPMAAEAVQAALTIGMRFLRATRLGIPRPPELVASAFVPDNDIVVRQQRFADLSQEVESRGRGFAVAKRVGDAINSRLGRNGPWFANLSQVSDANEISQIRRAISEWADGDTVCAHYAYGNDVLCTEDVAASGGHTSVFDQTTRTWLATDYGIDMCTIRDLSGRLCPF